MHPSYCCDRFTVSNETLHLIHMLTDLPKEVSDQVLSNGESGQLIREIENFLSEATMTLLIPDRKREQREDFVWCVPVERKSWAKWFDLSVKFKTATPDGMRYMNRMEGKKVRTLLIIPNASQSDDDVLTACAWLRMVKQLDCRMYVIRCTDDPQTMAKLINHAAGVDPALLEEVDDANPSNAQDTGADK